MLLDIFQAFDVNRRIKPSWTWVEHVEWWADFQARKAARLQRLALS